MRYYLSIVLFFISTAGSLGQELQPKGRFLADSLKIGEPIGFSLSLKYPRELDILFPDSLYDFSPYELDHKSYFKTKSGEKYSYDSAVYYFLSFEIDSIQTLQLPVFVLHGGDSTEILTTPDSVIFKHMVAEVPDSVSAEAAPLIENTNYINVPLQFNYPYFIIGGIILLVAVILVVVFFGKPVRKKLTIRKLTRAHEKYLLRYNDLTSRTEEPTVRSIEEVLILWKKYLEKLEGKPYTKLTTKEIVSYYSPEGISEDLKMIDRALYARASSEQLQESYVSLRTFSQQQFESKIEEVKNG